MELSTREDIEAPLDQVFGLATSFERLERQAMRHGIEVTRVSPDGATPDQGLSWRASFYYRGKAREADIALTRFDPPNTMVYTATSGGLDAVTTIDFVPLSPMRTRVGLKVEVLPRTLSARLLVQSLKLARGNIEKRFSIKIAEYASEIETRLNRSA
ncbi:DNA polymerase III subunit gamma/tau [Salipiger aestuarii]|uniref:Polyketide cyclase/dehydrase/lipid transport protein n=1 Tax=Salipiger aestuarii TaxID=568098 RepID=A0A327YSN7_9RHOB|nr:SRPBCC family protein [Salipiger aestuarii]EIE51131.1 hypothetical protein C357_09942 [Citreicella sp. 357]KAB2543359.1 DNA polymerase III subunit gamma/tau [Salipiger aestuarii]RAK23970.1 polyketide cyclase/dehydrase/lipid transport protein [Salipiger aestuarii]